MYTLVKENIDLKKILTQNIQEIRAPWKDQKKNNRNRGREKKPKSRYKNTFNKIIEKNVPQLKKEIPINVQQAYRTPDRLDQNFY